MHSLTPVLENIWTILSFLHTALHWHWSSSLALKHLTALMLRPWEYQNPDMIQSLHQIASAHITFSCIVLIILRLRLTSINKLTDSIGYGVIVRNKSVHIWDKPSLLKYFQSVVIESAIHILQTETQNCT